MDFLRLTNIVIDDFFEDTERIEEIIISKSSIVEVRVRTSRDFGKGWNSLIIALHNECREEYYVKETMDEIYEMLK